jgi:hypothetical protein
MRTILKRAETRSLGIAATPEAVHAYLSDGRNLPEWAPGFASRIRRHDRGWVVARGEIEFAIDVPAEPLSGTVDFLAPGEHARGLYARVLPNGEGAELTFTIMFTPDTPDDVVAAQMLTLETELAAIRRACEW